HPLDAAPARAYVLNVFVEPGDRGRGLARTLMDHLLAEARARDVRVVALHASGLGRPLYERMGFTPTNEMRLVLEPA
ncbi:GNAT family N-acetyltransferase, partial [Deinococcus pimensis]|uniref:GNAT family N-acetyltransferase n=1 Tax=Deinococcus pimensis TaxID=309888 RepID=UPI0005EAF6EC